MDVDGGRQILHDGTGHDPARCGLIPLALLGGAHRLVIGMVLDEIPRGRGAAGEPYETQREQRDAAIHRPRPFPSSTNARSARSMPSVARTSCLVTPDFCRT